MIKHAISSGRLLALSTLFSGMLILASCEKEDDENDIPGQQTYSLSGSASGGQEVPAVTTGGSGTLSGSYNSASNTLIYSINWSNLSGDASMAHFHGPAEAGVNADVLLPLDIVTNGMNGNAYDSLVVSDDFETALLAGKVYYNLHTLANPNGEIRGQVITTKN